MTIEELESKYGFDRNTSVDALKDTDTANTITVALDPVYLKHLPACWIIQDVYGHVDNGTISLGKAREYVAAIIEEHLKNPE